MTAAPMCACWMRWVGRESAVAPTSRRMVGPRSLVATTMPSAGRAMPGTRPRRRRAAVRVAPVFPAVTKASASPSLTSFMPTLMEASGFAFTASIVSCMAITSGASTTRTFSGASPSSALTSASRPTRRSSTSSRRAASSAPLTTSAGLWSPPMASTVIRGLICLVALLLSPLDWPLTATLWSLYCYAALRARSPASPLDWSLYCYAALRARSPASPLDRSTATLRSALAPRLRRSTGRSTATLRSALAPRLRRSTGRSVALLLRFMPVRSARPVVRCSSWPAHERLGLAAPLREFGSNNQPLASVRQWREGVVAPGIEHTRRPTASRSMQSLRRRLRNAEHARSRLRRTRPSAPVTS